MVKYRAYCHFNVAINQKNVLISEEGIREINLQPLFYSVLDLFQSHVRLLLTLYRFPLVCAQSP